MMPRYDTVRRGIRSPATGNRIQDPPFWFDESGKSPVGRRPGDRNVFAEEFYCCRIGVCISGARAQARTSEDAERTLGPHTSLGLECGLNAHSKDGGLLCAMPFR